MRRKLSVVVMAAIFMVACFGLAACGGNASTASVEKESSDNGGGVQSQPADSSGSTSEEFAVGSKVTLGSYEQDNNEGNGAEPITWLVLDVKDGKALLVSEAGLDSRQFHSAADRDFMKSELDRAWETSDLKAWLEGTFLSEAFTAEEQGRIDTITCLSSDEVERYFSSDNDRKCVPTPYALANGASTSDEGVCAWWLCTARSSGAYSPDFVNVDGQVDHGLGETHDDVVVRPAVWVSLD